MTSGAGGTRCVSTGYFLRLAKRVTGKDLKSFADQWLYSAGCPVFSCSFSFNRKRSTVEVDLKQSTLGNAHKKVAGSLLIRVHEVDGVFDHHVHIDDFVHHFELPVHARAKKIKRKKKEPPSKAPTGIGAALAPAPSAGAASVLGAAAAATAAGGGGGAEEDAFVSPLSWIRLDPDMEWIAGLELHQPEFMWIEQLQSDRDVVAQHEALSNLRRQPGEAVVEPVEKVLNDPKIFYRIRIEAAEVLSQCAPTSDTHIGGLKLVSFYNKGFALQSTETVVVPVPRTNNFEALQSYFVQKALPMAMSMVKTRNGTLMELVGQILLNMMRFNDNTGNAYSDNYHVATMIGALCAHLQARRDLSLPVERLAREFVKELDRYSIVERIQPYYHNTVMVAILGAWRELRKMDIAISHAITRPERLVGEGNFIRVRLAALEFFLATESTALSETTFETIEALLLSPRRCVRLEAAEALARLSTKQIARREDFALYRDRLWRLVEANHADVGILPRLLLFVSRVIDPAPGDALARDTTMTPAAPATPTLAPSAAAQHELSSEDESMAALRAEASAGKPEEPDWFLEVAGDGLSTLTASGRGSHASSTTGALPKLRLSVPPAAVPTGVPIKSKLQAVFQTIWSNYDSFPFRFPVDPSVAGYYKVIKNPCDLTLIRNRLESGTIESVAQFCDNLRLMFDNCFFFNLPDSLIYEQAKRLRSLAFKELKASFPELARDIKTTLMTKEPNLSTLPAASSEATWIPTPPREKPVGKKAMAPRKRGTAVATDASGGGKRAAAHKGGGGSGVAETPVEERMQKVLERAKAHPYAFWFLDPVDPVALNIPTYPEIIKEPMDLSTLEGRLRGGGLDVREFDRLLNLIFSNCITFNPANTLVHRNAIDMQRAMQKMAKRLLPELAAKPRGGDSGGGQAAPPSVIDEDGSQEEKATVPPSAMPSIKLKISLAGAAPTAASPPSRTGKAHEDLDRASPHEALDKALAQKILDKVSAHELAGPFLKPVDPVALNIPSYPKVIKEPMDLSTIQAKLEEVRYASLQEMHADFKLMFANCYKFNGRKAPISQAARVLEQFYNGLYQQTLG